MQITINKHYNFIFDPGEQGESFPFALWNGIYLVERTLTYADMAKEGIDLYESLYAPIGKGKQEYELNVEKYLDDIFYKLVSPKTEKDMWVPESLVVGYPDPNVKEYHAVMITADLGVHDNPRGVVAVKDIIKTKILEAVGTGLITDRKSSPILNTTSGTGGSSTVFEVEDVSEFSVNDVVIIEDTNSYNVDATALKTILSIDTIHKLVTVDIPYATDDLICEASCDYDRVTTKSITDINTFNGKATLEVSSTVNFNINDMVTVDGTEGYDGIYQVLNILSNTEIVIDCPFGEFETTGTVSTTALVVDTITGTISNVGNKVRITTSDSTTHFQAGDTITITNTSKHNGIFTITAVNTTTIDTNCPFIMPGETGTLSVDKEENLNPTVDINVYNTEWMTVEQYNVLKEQRRDVRSACPHDILNHYEAWRACQDIIEEQNARIEALETIIIDAGI